MVDKRPKTELGLLVATPMDAAMFNLLGGTSQGSVGFTKDQIGWFQLLYGIDPTKDENALLIAGSRRNMMRRVGEDGLRVMAYLSRYLEPGQDPVRFLQSIMAEAGFDVPDLVEEEPS